MEIRPLTPNEIVNIVNPACVAKGWAELNVNEEQPTCMVLGAFEGENLIQSLTLQLHPLLGPMIKHDHSITDNGQISRELAAGMAKFVAGSRGVLIIADSPVSERLCERYGMEKIASPVYFKANA